VATLTVGQGQQFTTIGAAVAASRDGDVVQVQAGTYTNDFATINTQITLQGVGGMVHMRATGPVSNDKGLLITNTDVTIDHFEFSGATGGSGNAAGIRYQGGDLTVTNSYFHDNQNGLLANPVDGGTITIRNSEFDHNGAGDGYTHNIYVGDIARLTIADSFFHDAVIGHQIKSRAQETIITGTRIFDEDGTSSYSVDLPNGGRAVLTGNTIQQGPNGDNPNIVAFGAEGNLHAGSSLTMTGNIVVNDMGRGALLWNVSGSPAALDGNQVWGVASNQLVSGSGATVTNTTYLAAEPALDASHPWTGAGPAPGAGPGPGDDVLQAAPGATEIHAGAGNDTISGSAGEDYLRGDDGNDSLSGGGAFDDLHGNIGDDTVRGGDGGDWVVGGQNNDQLFGDAGGDVVLGNLGADTCEGGLGDDVIRGGQADDVLRGGDGSDWLSGDRGTDTVTGGAGADIFHTFGEAGVDLVTDFSVAQGDRVMLDPGTTYTAAQVGADVVLSLNAGGRMTLANVSIGSLGQGWIFGG
jgi:Ca2+-binding RTX toxin-like protein